MRDSLHVERRRFRQEGLRLRGLLSRHVRLRHRALFYRPHRTAVAAIEDVREALLRQLHDDRDPLSVDGDIEQDRMCRHVVVPDVVMNQLLVPHLLARARFHRDERVAIEVVTGAMATVDIVGWRLDRQVDQTELRVGRERSPQTSVPGVVGRPILPGLVTRLALARDSVEGPAFSAGADVEGHHVGLRIGLVHAGTDQHRRTDDHGVADDHRR